MKASSSIIIWIFIFVIFLLFGLQDELVTFTSAESGSYRADEFLGAIIIWGGLGFGTANCVGVAWLLLALVAAQKLHITPAVILNTAICTFSFAIPPYLMWSIPDRLQSTGLHPFHGETGLTCLIGTTSIMFFVAVTAVVIFIPCAIIINRKSKKQIKTGAPLYRPLSWDTTGSSKSTANPGQTQLQERIRAYHRLYTDDRTKKNV